MADSAKEASSMMQGIFDYMKMQVKSDVCFLLLMPTALRRLIISTACQSEAHCSAAQPLLTLRKWCGFL